MAVPTYLRNRPEYKGREDESFGPKEMLGQPAVEEESKDLLPATVPEFKYPKFDSPDFDPTDIGFTERKASPLDLSSIMKQTKQRQAITGVTPSAEFVSGIAEPALKEKTRESIAFEELNRQREIEQRKQAFTEFSTTRGQEFAEFGAERDIAFKGHILQWEREVKEIELQIAKTQAEKDTGGGKIICTELYRQGLLPKSILNYDGEYREKYIDDEVYCGYLALAYPIVKIMKKSKIFTIMIKPLGKAFAYEAASRMDENIKSNLLGRLCFKFGIPVCKYYFKIRMRFILRFVREAI